MSVVKTVFASSVQMCASMFVTPQQKPQEVEMKDEAEYQIIQSQSSAG